MAINPQKMLPSSRKANNSLAKYSKNSSAIKSIKLKVIQIDKLLKGTLADDKKKLDDEKREDSKKRREDIEEKLETKPKAEKGKIKMPKVPKMGFLDWIKNFIGNILLGYFAVRLVDHLPKILPILRFIGKASDFVIDVGGKLLNGLVTFVDWGYKAYDATRGFIKNIGGENFAKIFDKFNGAVGTLIDTAVIAAIVIATQGRDESWGQGPQKPRRGGKPRVTTSGGGAAGRPDIRSPFRQKPTVTTGQGGKPGGFRLPGTGPNVTGGGGPKLKLPKGIKARGGLLGLVFLIPDLIDAGMLVSQGRGKDGLRTLLSAVSGVVAGMAAYSATLAGAAALGITGVGLPAAIGLAVAGLAASSVAGAAAYNLADAGLKKMGLVDKDPKTGNPYTYRSGGITRGGKRVTGARRTLSKGIKGRYKRKTPQKPGEIKIDPGSNVGGEEKIFGLFPKPKIPGLSNPFNVVKKSGKQLGKSDYFGPILAITSKILLGQKPSQNDYKNVGLGINLLLSKGIEDGQLKGGVVAAFANGGFVDPETLSAISSGGDITDWVASTFKKSTEQNTQKTLREILENINLKKDTETGIQDSTSGPAEYGTIDSDGVSVGGISGTGVTKAVSVAKKLIADLGVTPAQAAGIVGNFLYESAGMNPGEREGAPYGTPERPPSIGTIGVGYGWAQWTNSAPGDRLDKFLKSYGGDKGKIATDDDNYRFLMTELKGAESLTKKGVETGTMFPKDDPIAASDWFRVNWERAGVPADEKRRRETLAVFQKIKGLSRDKAKADVAAAGGSIGNIGDSRTTGANPKAKQILAGAKKIVGMGAGVGDQCANTTRAALKAAGHPAANKVTQKGDLDTPKGTAYNAPSFAASFGGSDMGQIIRNRKNIRAGDIILWRDYAGGKYGKGAITHVGIAADEGLKHQYDHNKKRGWHYRSHWDRGSGTEWFAGVRLMDAGGMVNKLTPAILGERGKPEGVIGSKVTEYLEEMAPGTLPAIIGSKSKQELSNVLRTFNDYGFGPQEEIIIFDDGDSTTEDYDDMNSQGFSGIVPTIINESDPFESLDFIG